MGPNYTAARNEAYTQLYNAAPNPAGAEPGIKTYPNRGIITFDSEFIHSPEGQAFMNFMKDAAERDPSLQNLLHKNAWGGYYLEVDPSKMDPTSAAGIAAALKAAKSGSTDLYGNYLDASQAAKQKLGAAIDADSKITAMPPQRKDARPSKNGNLDSTVDLSKPMTDDQFNHLTEQQKLQKIKTDVDGEMNPDAAETKWSKQHHAQVQKYLDKHPAHGGPG